MYEGIQVVIPSFRIPCRIMLVMTSTKVMIMTALPELLPVVALREGVRSIFGHIFSQKTRPMMTDMFWR